ncbi:F-box protein CPR1-like [Lycium ferocissimum]|uniref:F-box protein CPR1-like n=1 Tax=Lycium ferocissimum TaxID=112874 RepID=UPI0028152A38|nr:F-box protein CPR1-like [Lycium ferocissimum]
MKHLNRAKNDLNSQILAAQHPAKSNYAVKFSCFSLSSVQVVEDEQRLDCPSNCKPACTICCCCDGLVLLSTCDRLDRHLLLWIPSTRESIVLPYPGYYLGDWVYGLGYNATSDDYKILAVDLNRDYSENVSAEILALIRGSWRKIGDYPTGIGCAVGYLNCGMDSLAFIHGAFHWLGKSAYYIIVSFNISNEVYGEIPLLERMCNIFDLRLDHGVSVLRGMLCYYSTSPKLYHQGTFKLWVMKDYGVKESWTQLLTIQDANYIRLAKPKYMFADGEVLLRCLPPLRITSLYWTSKRGPFELWPEPVLSQGIVYTESLISPKLLI